MPDDRGRLVWHTDHELGPCPDFVSAAELVVAHLNRHTPLDLWWVTQVSEADQIVVASAGAWSGEFPAGTTVPWLESYCLQMAARRAPAVTPRLRAFARDTGRGGGWWDRADGYAGAPLVHDDGELFGTLAGFSGRADDPEIVGAAGNVRVLARMLSTILTAHLDSADLRGELAASWELNQTDALTGLRNRRGWEEGLAAAGRCGARDPTAGVIAIDLDGLKETNDAQGHQAGDRLLVRTAKVLAAACRPSDLLARSGGDEFVVLAGAVGPAELDWLAVRVRERLRDVGISASLAGEAQLPGESLVDTWARADRTMYAEKRRRHSLPR